MEESLDSSDIRAISVLGGYLSICGLLTGIIVNELITGHRKLKSRVSYTHILALASCAAVSLGITWYYMLSFFGLSYRVWALQHGISLPITPHNINELRQCILTIHLGAWLKEVQLFRDAWETAMESYGRLFWSQPIFIITTAWALFIGDQVSTRKIKHGWMYMVLGQIVAISFAQSLFYLAVMLFEPRTGKASPTASTKTQATKGSCIPYGHTFLRLFIVALVGFSVVMIPGVIHTPRFLWVLALPHLALLLPPLIGPLLVTKSLTAEDQATVQEEDNGLYHFIAVVALILQFKVIDLARNDMSVDRHLHRHSAVYIHPILDSPSMPSSSAFYGILASLYDHPAVTSVGMDSILCVLNYQVWRILEHKQ